MKKLQDILRENGYKPPPEESIDVPDWQEPQKPIKRWMTIGETFEAGGKFCDMCVEIVHGILAVIIWTIVAIILFCVLLILLGGCRG